MGVVASMMVAKKNRPAPVHGAGRPAVYLPISLRQEQLRCLHVTVVELVLVAAPSVAVSVTVYDRWTPKV